MTGMLLQSATNQPANHTCPLSPLHRHVLHLHLPRVLLSQPSLTLSISNSFLPFPNPTIKKPKTMSAGIGPTPSDISFSLPSSPTPHHRLLSFRQLNSLALSLILASSGMIPLSHIALPLLSLPYLLLLSRFSFPSLSPSPPPPVFSPRTRLLSLYVAFAALLALLLPVLYIFEGIMEGDREGIEAAAPHVFLLACQVFVEGVTFSGNFSLPIRAFVPVFYNAIRMFALIEWGVVEMGKDGGEGRSELRLLGGRVLAGANLVFWGFNLFGFLLPVYLPRALKRHYACKEN